LALLLVSGAGACAQKTGTGTAGQRMDTDAAIYQECTSVCVRPGDCAKAYNDDGICPPGFYCSLRFNCSTD
jgi:hypothetical protein